MNETPNSHEVEFFGDEGNVAVIEIQPGVGLVVGDLLPEGLDVTPLSLLDDSARDKVTHAATQALGWANAGAQAAQGVVAARGLVQLDAATVQALKQGATLMQSQGKTLSVLMKNGKIVGHARFVPAAAGTASTMAASLGPATVMLGIQAELNRLASLSKHNIELTRELRSTIKDGEWSETVGHHRDLREAVETAMRIGAVSDSVWQGVAPKRGELLSQVERASRALKRLTPQLPQKNKDAKERQQFLVEHAEEMIGDAQALVRAVDALTMYRLLEAGNAHARAEQDPREASRRDHLVEVSRQYDDEAKREAREVLRELRVELNVAAGLKANWYAFDRRLSRKNATDAAQLAGILNQMAERLGDATPQYEEPRFEALEQATAPSSLRTVLPWRLSDDERLLGVAEVADTSGIGVGDIGRRRYLAMTDRHLYVMVPREVESDGVVREPIPAESIRYVRVRPGDEKQPPRLTVATTEEDYSFEFGSWAKGSDKRDAAVQFSNLVASRMHLPADEVPVVPPQE